ncbi:MAG: MBL fold metallo-hydrolase [Lachnospiraceae bacterium]|nr:MBL fold metallo-hydrolase [Lachnospiraceae bacterium]
MRVVNLIENTEGAAGCAYMHGLSFYIETRGHKLLLDLGPSEETLRNAEKLGIDLSLVDTVILSHGHYDHSGGLMAFAKINPDAVIYMQRTADGEYYADDGERDDRERYRYIGIDKRIADLNQIKIVDGDLKIDDELEILTVKERTYALPFTNRRLLIKEESGFVRDDFKHEQFLVIKENGRSVLMSGCAHNGMMNILDAYKKKYGSVPEVVISGFHLKKKDAYSDEELKEIIEIAKSLKKYATRFITCHCTGEQAYNVMKNIMGNKLGYVHSGEEINIRFGNKNKENKRRSTYMKWHKIFAWATVVCFIMTMVTGYQKK